MKKILTIVAALMIFSAAPLTVSGASAPKDDVTATQKIKPSKEAKKEAKRLEKEGWRPAPGGLPIAVQLERAYNMQAEIKLDGTPKYILGDASTIGTSYDAAKRQSNIYARQDLAGKIATEITSLMSSEAVNEQITPEEAKTYEKTIISQRQLISQRLGRLTDVVEIYRTLPDGKTEVRVMLSYDTAEIRRLAKDTFLDALPDADPATRTQIDHLFEE